MIPSITETWTVVDPDGNEVWSSGPNDETSGAADFAARECSGSVLRAVYALKTVEEDANYAPRPAVLKQRNEISAALAAWKAAAGGDSEDAEHDAARNMADILEKMLG
jgi:hypothetical protein